MLIARHGLAMCRSRVAVLLWLIVLAWVPVLSAQQPAAALPAQPPLTAAATVEASGETVPFVYFNRTITGAAGARARPATRGTRRDRRTAPRRPGGPAHQRASRVDRGGRGSRADRGRPHHHRDRVDRRRRSHARRPRGRGQSRGRRAAAGAQRGRPGSYAADHRSRGRPLDPRAGAGRGDARADRAGARAAGPPARVGDGTQAVAGRRGLARGPARLAAHRFLEGLPLAPLNRARPGSQLFCGDVRPAPVPLHAAVGRIDAGVHAVEGPGPGTRYRTRHPVALHSAAHRAGRPVRQPLASSAVQRRSSSGASR